MTETKGVITQYRKPWKEKPKEKKMFHLDVPIRLEVPENLEKEQGTLKMFLDPEYTQELKDPINFGIVEAGTCEEMRIFLLNNSDAFLLEIKFTLPKIEGLSFSGAIPLGMDPHSKSQLKLKWCPSKKKEGLKVDLQIAYSEVYKPPEDKLSTEEKIETLTCEICNQSFQVEQYYEHLNSHSREEVLKLKELEEKRKEE